jgi:hypothetical protein
MTREGSRTREQQAAQLAAELIVFADGAEEAGLISYAQRARVVARETIWLAETVERERSARRAIQAARDRCMDILMGHHTCNGCREAMRDASRVAA